MLCNGGLGSADGFFSLNKSLGGETMPVQVNIGMNRYST